MRKRLWQLHSWLGLFAGLGLVLIGLTGSLLMFHHELEALFNRELVIVEPTSAGRPGASAPNRLPLDTLLAHAQRQLPDHEIAGWLPQYDEPELADVLYVLRHGSDQWQLATLNQYTGELLATPRGLAETLTGVLLELHYTFFADHVGMILTGLFGLVLCVLGVTGVWLYRSFWKNLLTLRWKSSARILFSDFHKFVGITSVAFNLLLGFTGAYWNITHVIGEDLPALPEQPPMERRLYSDTLSLEALQRDAAQRLPGFRANYISLPFMPERGVVLWGTIEPRGPFPSPYGSTVAYDAQTGAHQATTDLREAGLWTRIVDTFRPLHYGPFGGWPVKILWTIGGLTPGALAVTGFVIWRLRRRRRQSAPEFAARPVVSWST